MNRSSRPLQNTVVSLVLLMILVMTVPAAGAQYPNPKTHDYDPENGEEINELCAGCHGEFGQGGGDGEYPRLAGLPAKYLAKQLHQFKIQERNSVAMSMYATDREISATDLLDISIYLAEQKLLTIMPDFTPETTSLEKLQTARLVFNVARYKGDTVKGQDIFDTNCAKCHGKGGLGKGSTPQLAGQYTDYIRLQIGDFQSGKRVHKRMEKYIMPLTAEDIEALLAFLSIADD